MNLASLIDRMIAAGVSPGEAGALAAEIYAAGVASGIGQNQPTAAAARMNDYRNRREAMGLPRVFQAADYRPQLIERDGERCIYCEATEQLVIDHIHPSFLGGDDDIRNLGLACRPCNGRKAGKPLIDTGMNIIVETAARAHSGYKPRTQFTLDAAEHSSPIPRTAANSREHVHPPSISLDKNSKKEKRGSQLPDDWKPDEVRWTAACRKLGQDGAERELSKFTSHHRAKGTVFKIWNFAWDKWLLNSADWTPKQAAGVGVVHRETVNWRAVLESYKKYKTWPKGHGNDPTSPACWAPSELLREFGFELRRMDA